MMCLLYVPFHLPQEKHTGPLPHRVPTKNKDMNRKIQEFIQEDERELFIKRKTCMHAYMIRCLSVADTRGGEGGGNNFDRPVKKFGTKYHNLHCLGASGTRKHTNT